jgi:hypothetical protein
MGPASENLHKSGSRTSFDHFVGQRQFGGTAILSCFAVLRFTTNQNLLACSIGRSPGFAPWTILAASAPARPADWPDRRARGPDRDQATPGASPQRSGGRHVMSAKGQNAKHSNRANAFRITPELRHCSEQLACLKGAKTGRDPA